MRPGLPVAAVALALAVAGAAGAAGEPPSRTVAMPGKLYDPGRVAVLVGTTVTWRNEDGTNHTVTAEGGAFDSGLVAPGGSFSFTFDRAGRYAYRCTIHRFMRGVADVHALVLTGPAGPVRAGAPVVLTGLAPAGTTAVRLTRAGDPEPRVLRPRPDGSFVARVDGNAPGAYRAATTAGPSPVVRVNLVPAVRVRRVGARLVASASPARAGATVLLQRFELERYAWRTIARGRLGARSTARFAVPAGVERVRALVRGADGWADAASPALVLGR